MGGLYADLGPCLVTEPSRDARLAAVVRLASVLGVGRVVAVRLEEPGGGERYLVASVVDAATGSEAREAKVKVLAAGLPVGAMPRLAEFLATGEAAAPVEPLGGFAATEPPLVTTAPLTSTRRSNHLRTGAYVSAGATIASFAIAGYFGLQSAAAARDVRRLCPGGACTADGQARLRDFERDRTTATIAGAVGGVALATGVALFVLSSKEDSVAVTAAPGGAAIAGRF